MCCGLQFSSLAWRPMSVPSGEQLPQTSIPVLRLQRLSDGHWVYPLGKKLKDESYKRD